MMSTKFEAFQTLMLAASEANFYASLPVFVQHVSRLQRSSTPVDLIVSGFTLMGAGMVVSEFCEVPLAGFILQPTIIPSEGDPLTPPPAPSPSSRRQTPSGNACCPRTAGGAP
jgi:hypothetical protein